MQGYRRNNEIYIMGLFKWYYNNRKKLLVIPIVLFVVGIFLAQNLKLGVDLQGGAFITGKNLDVEKIKKDFPESKITILSNQIVVEIPYFEIPSEDYIKNYFKEAHVFFITQDLANQIKNITISLLIVSSILIAIVLLFAFKDIKPLIVILISIIFDITMILAGCSILNIPLSLDVIVMILIQVGYSIDTDVVMSNYVIKEGLKYGLKKAASIGLTMSATSLIAMIIIAGLGYIIGNIIVFRLGCVLTIGILADLIVTWLLNPNLLEVMGYAH
jgi:preprotein translocase subunit SecF